MGGRCLGLGPIYSVAYLRDPRCDRGQRLGFPFQISHQLGGDGRLFIAFQPHVHSFPL